MEGHWEHVFQGNVVVPAAMRWAAMVFPVPPVRISFSPQTTKKQSQLNMGQNFKIMNQNIHVLFHIYFS